MTGVDAGDLNAWANPPSYFDRDIVVGADAPALTAAVVSAMWDGTYKGESTTTSLVPFGLGINVKHATQHRSECAQLAQPSCPLQKEHTISADQRCGDNGRWKLLFRQTGPTFQSKANWKASSVNNSEADNFSILNQFEKFRGPGGEFELQLSWPRDKISFHWRQNSNPMTRTSGGVTGYSPINVPSTWASSGSNGFIGLGFHAGTETLLKGSKGTAEWWYAVGTTAPFKANLIPGPHPITVTQVEVHVCDEQVQSSVTVKSGSSYNITATAVSGRSIDVVCLPNVYDPVYADRGYKFASLGDFATNKTTGSVHYVRASNDDKHTGASQRMWTFSSTKNVTVYLDLLGSAAQQGSGAGSWLLAPGSKWVKQQGFTGVTKHVPPVNKYTLGPVNKSDCPVNTTLVPQSECQVAARSVLPTGVEQGRKNFLVSSAAGWSYAPSGCSVQSGGDWATHFNYANSSTDGNDNNLHRLVCKLQPPPPVAGGDVYAQTFMAGTFDILGNGAGAGREFCRKGNRSGVYCCAASCGTCGGTFLSAHGNGCESRSGGAEACCDGAMRRTCSDRDDVACVISEARDSTFVAFLEYDGHFTLTKKRVSLPPHALLATPPVVLPTKLKTCELRCYEEPSLGNWTTKCGLDACSRCRPCTSNTNCTDCGWSPEIAPCIPEINAEQVFADRAYMFTSMGGFARKRELHRVEHALSAPPVIASRALSTSKQVTVYLDLLPGAAYEPSVYSLANSRGVSVVGGFLPYSDSANELCPAGTTEVTSAQECEHAAKTMLEGAPYVFVQDSKCLEGALGSATTVDGGLDMCADHCRKNSTCTYFGVELDSSNAWNCNLYIDGQCNPSVSSDQHVYRLLRTPANTSVATPTNCQGTTSETCMCAIKTSGSWEPTILAVNNPSTGLASGDVPLLAAKFSDVCPTGTSPINNIADCTAAVLALVPAGMWAGLTLEQTADLIKKLAAQQGTYTTTPPGCFLQPSNNRVYFNTEHDSPGTAGTKYRRVCTRPTGQSWSKLSGPSMHFI